MAAFDNTILVSRNKIDFYFGGKVSTFIFAPAIVHDLEVLDADSFKSGLNSFLDENKITFGTCGILLSDNVCFVSDVIPKSQNQEDALSSFISTLPFENPVARILGDKIVGTNKDLYQIVADVIGAKGGRVKMISPVFLSKEMFGRKGLDEEMVKFVSENEDTYFKATFAYEATMPAPMMIEVKPQKRSKREFILIGVFAALLVGFVVWLLTRIIK